MQDDLREPPEPNGLNMQTLLYGLRAAGAVIGLITMGVGLTYTLKLLALILDALKHPEKVERLLTMWQDALGGEQLDLIVQDVSVHTGPLLAIAVLGGLTLLLPKISIALITAGAKVLAETLGDREAVKKLLTQAFGNAHRPTPPKDAPEPQQNKSS